MEKYGKTHISMAMFNSYVSLPEGMSLKRATKWPCIAMPSLNIHLHVQAESLGNDKHQSTSSDQVKINYMIIIYNHHAVGNLNS